MIAVATFVVGIFVGTLMATNWYSVHLAKISHEEPCTCKADIIPGARYKSIIEPSLMADVQYVSTGPHDGRYVKYISPCRLGDGLLPREYVVDYEIFMKNFDVLHPEEPVPLA